jgi:hypothetical protein
MKAYDLCLFFVVLNASFWMLWGLGVWNEPGLPRGQLASNLTYALIVGVTTDVAASAVVFPYGTRARSPDTQAIFWFGLIYWPLVTSGLALLSSLYVPTPVILFLGAVQALMFVTAVIQMAAKVSFKIMD